MPHTAHPQSPIPPGSTVRLQFTELTSQPPMAHSPQSERQLILTSSRKEHVLFLFVGRITPLQRGCHGLAWFFSGGCSELLSGQGSAAWHWAAWPLEGPRGQEWRMHRGGSKGAFE